MTDNQQNDRDFFSRLNRYGETPPPHVREELQARLKEKKKRRVGAFWWLGSGYTAGFRVAAVLTGALLVFYFLQKETAQDVSLTMKAADTISAIDSSTYQGSPSPDVEVKSNDLFDRIAGNDLSSEENVSTVKDTVEKKVKNADRRFKDKRRKKSPTPLIAEKPDVQSEQPVEDLPALVSGGQSENEENPFLPEGTPVFSQQQECEDETVRAVNISVNPVVDSAVAASPIFPDSMKIARPLRPDWSWSLALTGGVNQWNNRYTDGTSSIDPDALEGAEGQVVSFLGGAELRASFGNWMITSGVAYARQSEDWAFKTIRSDFGETGAAFVYNDTTIGSYTLLNGYDATWSDPPVPGNTSTLSNLTLTDTMIRNDYSRFSIPLLIGYRLKAGERMSLGLHTGVAYTNLFDADVWLYNITDRTVQRTDEKDEVWRRNSFDALFRIEAAYAVTDRFSVLLRPAGSLMLTSQFKENYPARRRSLRQSVEAGVVLMW